MMHIKSLVFSEIPSHTRLFSLDRNSLVKYLASPYRIILIVIFTVLFLPHVFVVVRDINFVMAYEVDPGSIIQSILALFKNSYNMNASYHSKYYGWTYFSINYLLLMPVYIADALKLVTDDFYLFVGIRFIFFMIGLLSVLAFFEVAKNIFKQNIPAFLGAILYIASPAVFKFFYFLHPETTGLLFLFVSILCLLRYHEGAATDPRWYLLGLLSLVMSALSKQVFFFIVPGVIFSYLYVYCFHHRKTVFEFIFSKQFIKAFVVSAVFSLLVFFVINPFAFLQPKVFITNQIVLVSGNTQSTITEREAIGNWLQVVKSLPIMSVSIFLFPFTVIGALFLGRGKPMRVERVLYIVNILFCVLFVVLIAMSLRFSYSAQYFAPIYPFFILNFLSVPLYMVRKWNSNLLRWMILVPLAYFLFFVLVRDFSFSLPTGYDRLMYKETAMYEIYNYIQQKIPDGSRIAHDHLVAVPSVDGLIGCQYWQGGCGTDYIEKFQPDYVIFSETWKHNGQTVPGTLRLQKYVKDHHFVLIDTINYGNGQWISVWQKPDQ